MQDKLKDQAAKNPSSRQSPADAATEKTNRILGSDFGQVEEGGMGSFSDGEFNRFTQQLGQDGVAHSADEDNMRASQIALIKKGKKGKELGQSISRSGRSSMIEQNQSTSAGCCSSKGQDGKGGCIIF